MSKKGKNTLRRRNVHNNKQAVELKKRIIRINEAISKKDLNALRRLATTGPGLINDGLRRLCWPLLLHYKNHNVEVSQVTHKDEYQVSLDVNRSFVHFPKGLSDKEKKQKQSVLYEVIVGILRRQPNLSYYQGFHDVCSSLLEVLGKEGAIKAGENIAMFLLRDALYDSLDPIMNQLDLLDTLIYLEDSLLYDFFRRSNMMPYFCVSWVITWCSHDLHDFSKITRLFDFFIASNPLMALYLSARVVINRRKELLLLECDSAIIHGFLSKFPQEIDVDDLIFRTSQLYQKYPPHVLQEMSGLLLAKTSSVNLYDEHWLILRADDTVDYSEANKILLLPSSERKPTHFDKSKKSDFFSNLYKTHALTILFAASASIVAAVLIASRWFMSKSVAENFGL
ncbi:rab-GTPase-TBC domain-containing protein [Gigaspora rosea]|uniref:Rab-GTPase-TBC domain-containing protein n=1 Tax=Gigaspora rosea TaxID=44941 RepID=A0A397UUJ5_9GLOM|nr:rab-GTPase-TBC domain-containing protein [Gigaspora rosea]